MKYSNIKFITVHLSTLTETVMLDFILIAGTLVFFGLSFGLITFYDSLSRSEQ